MPKKKNFISQSDISTLLKKYGGGYRWKQNKNLSQKGVICYRDKFGYNLTINEKYELDTNKPYVMVHISESDGTIFRWDKWSYFDTIHQLYFDYTVDKNNDYDLEFKELEGVTMAKKRQSHTQKLEAELKQYKEWLAKQEEIIKRMRERGEDSFMNSPTFIQMQDRIKFLEAAYKSQQIGYVGIQGRWKRFEESERKLYDDNKAFLEHDGDSDYFVGITECYKEINEVHRYKDEVKTLEGKIQGYKDIIAEHEKEIERLQGALAELKHKIPTTPVLSPKLQFEFDEAIRAKDTLQRLLDEEKDKSQKLSEKVEKLNKATTTALSDSEVEELKRQLSEAIHNANAFNNMAEAETEKRYKAEGEVSELRNRIAELEAKLSDAPTTDNVSDDELETLGTKDIRKKTSEEIDGTIPEDYKVTWFDYYDSMDRADLVKRLKYVETISERRSRKIVELKKELTNNRFEQYSEEDSITYNAALQKISSLERDLKMWQQFLENSNRRNDELQQQVTELASATLPPEETIKVVEENIKQDQELKKANQKKKGRPVTMDEHTIALIHELHKNGHSIRAIAKQIGKSVGTVHRILNEQ